MNILLLASRYLPHTGGLETVVHELAANLSQNHHVAIITNRLPRTLPATENIDGIQVTRYFFLFPRLEQLWSQKPYLFFAGLFFFPLTLFQLWRYIRNFRPDVVNVHYLGSTTLFILILHRLMNFRLVASLHGGDVDGEPHRNRFNRRLFTQAMKQVDHVTACSQYLLDQALDIAPEAASKSTVIHNGVDVQLFVEATPYQHRRPYVFAIGQLAAHKGFDLLIEAFAQIAADDIDLLIAGTGPDHDKLQAQIAQNQLVEQVYLIGRLDHNKVAEYMKGSQMIVMPSRREPFGIVAIEAYASGRPLIVSRVGGLVEALDGLNVHWVEPDDLEDLKQALADQIYQQTEYQVKTDLTRHDWTQVSRYYEDTLL
jgi:glycogen synthase